MSPVCGRIIQFIVLQKEMDMSGTKKAFKIHSETLKFVLMLLAGLLILILVHVIAIHRMAVNEIVEDMQQDVKVGSGIVAAELEKLGDMGVQGAAALSRVSNDPDFWDRRLTSVLGLYMEFGSFEETFFATKDGRLFMYNGQQIPLSGVLYESLWSEADRPGSYRMVSGLNLGRGRLYVVAPVYNGDERIGCFIGGNSRMEEFDRELNKYVELDDVLFISDANGNVLLKNSYLENEEFGGMTNVYSFLATEMSDESRLEGIKETIADEDSGFMRIYCDQKTYVIVFRELRNTENWFVASLMPTSAFTPAFVPQRGEEITLMMFDVEVMVVAIVVIFIISIRKNRILKKKLCFDPLTGLLTKDYFRIRGEELLKSSQVLYNVAVVDLVGFRHINELFGRKRGDEIIEIMARYLSKNLGSKELIARNSAECFEMMVVDRNVFRASVLEVSEILKIAAQNIDVTYPIMIRAGIVQSTGKNRDIEDLIDKANTARRAADGQKDIQILDYADVAKSDMKLREEIEAAQESAMAHGEFKVFLQPKMDVQKNCLAGAEALVRWIKRDGTMVYPDQFMPVFESNGFVEKLDFYMLDKVCALQKKLGEEGLERVPISVNQSPVLLMNPKYVDKVMDVLGRYEVPRSLIELELTETIFFGDKERMISIMRSLREQDCHIDIDDFGSGYSSLNMIKDIPFDTLKIDREFFTDSNNGTGRIILEKVVEMAQAMNVSCICEGVETAEQVELLRSIGCRYAQGYYYSKPIPADEFVEKFIRNKYTP